MTDLSTLPSYRSHKIVRAAPIVMLTGTMGPASVTGQPTGATPGMTKVVLQVDGAGPLNRLEVEIPDEVFARGRPDPGSYLVVYEDGYVSWSPKDVFEAGYTRDE